MKVMARDGSAGSRGFQLPVYLVMFVAAVPARALAPVAPATVLYVNAELGDDDCFDGLAPLPSVELPCPIPFPPVPPPPPPYPGPFKTITRALTTITQNPMYGNGPPFAVRMAGRWHEGLGASYIYGPAGPANYSGETFPLVVPPQTLLKADAANSERFGGSTVTVIIEAPLATGPAPYLPAAMNAIEFIAGAGVNFTAQGGLDGTEIPPYGIEVRGGTRNIYLQASGSGAAMSIRVQKVWFSGNAAYNFDAHINTGALGNFTVLDSQFTTYVEVGPNVPAGGGIAGENHTDQALVHLSSMATQVGGTVLVPVLTPTFTNNFITVVQAPGTPPGPRPEVPWGMVVDLSLGSDASPTISSLTVDGAASATTAEGILIGFEFGSNTQNLQGSAFFPRLPRLNLTASDIRNCAVFGAAVATGAGGTPPNPTITRLEIAGNQFVNNGVRPQALPNVNSNSTHSLFPGSGLHLVIREDNSWFVGTIANNTVTGNRTGIALSSGSVGPWAWFTTPPLPLPTEPQGLTISGNDISGQVFFPPGMPCPLPPAFCPPFPYPGDGVGLILADDVGSNNSGGPGLLDGRILVDSNRIHGNNRHGVWMRLQLPGSTISPLLRNDRIWGNGNVAPGGDGVRVELIGAPAGSTLTPTLLHETIVNQDHPGGFGVNNVAGVGSAISRPVIWNSIVYFNAGGVDLSGFSFPPFATGGLVNSTDFCGTPWGVGCGTQTTPNAAGCLSADPVFGSVLLSDFELTCSGAGSPPSCGCAGPPAGSACIDAGSPSPPAPLLPAVDAKGADRTVTLTAGLPPDTPDMGALEKQTCIP